MKCNCGTEVSDFESFCTNCGEFVEHNPVSTQKTFEVATSDDRFWAVAAHLSPFAAFVMPFGGNMLAPLAVLWIKRNNEFVADQAREALNFQISVSIYGAVTGLLMFVFLGWLIAPVLIIGALFLMITAAMKANNGEPFRYPFTLRLIK